MSIYMVIWPPYTFVKEFVVWKERSLPLHVVAPCYRCTRTIGFPSIVTTSWSLGWVVVVRYATFLACCTSAVHISLRPDSTHFAWQQRLC